MELSLEEMSFINSTCNVSGRKSVELLLQLAFTDRPAHAVCQVARLKCFILQAGC